MIPGPGPDWGRTGGEKARVGKDMGAAPRPEPGEYVGEEGIKGDRWRGEKIVYVYLCVYTYIWNI